MFYLFVRISNHGSMHFLSHNPLLPICVRIFHNSTVFLVKEIVATLVERFPTYRTRRFIAMFTKAVSS
jgi:hypothetical protein